jgi:hypothetical protein
VQEEALPPLARERVDLLLVLRGAERRGHDRLRLAAREERRAVDAPLDDANTERYSKLVRSMSQGTQSLFISHNKIAMEMAEQLIGVTMQEQGVSRIVVVDMASAVQLTGVA